MTGRGAMAILRELWTKEIPEAEVKTTYQYVVDLRDRMEDSLQLARENLQMSATAAKQHFDRKAKVRALEPGCQALVLLPTANNKLQMQWKGPYKVVARVGPTDYKVDFNGRPCQGLSHQYVARVPSKTRCHAY